MDPKKKIDTILTAVEARVQDEVGALLGAEFLITGGERRLLSKEEIFDELKGKQVSAQLDLVGELSGKACLLIGIKDAIRLGGTLIMLPSAELEEVSGREDYSEEIADSYGEIANIVAGSFTKNFEEMYQKSFRFIRKELEILVPAKVDIESPLPVENAVHYFMASSMTLEGRQLGDMVMLLPAEPFELLQQVEKPATAAVNKPATSPPPPKEDVSAKAESTTKTAVSPQAESKKTSSTKAFNVDKHKKKVDRLLGQCCETMAQEMGALLGVEVDLAEIENRFLDKEDFFLDHAVGKQVITNMEVVGEKAGMSYLSLGLKDAIYLGGVLIMLPPSELDNVVNDEDFSEDIKDAYGEVANIISGVYTAVFEENYIKKIRFIRKEFQEAVPAKVDPDSDEPIMAGSYYASTMSIMVDTRQLGRLHMLFPAELLQLESLLTGGVADDIIPEPAAAVEEKESVDDDSPQPVAMEEENPPVQPQVAQAATQQAAPVQPGQSAPQDSRKASEDLAKHKKRINKMLAACKTKMADEVSTMLGVEFELSNLENSIVSKEDFLFEYVSGKQVIANMDVVGDLAGKSYCSVNLKDAIRIGGTLIMLPAAELETVIADEKLTEDTTDAYGEIANIISGVYTAVFEEQYIKKVRFIKTDIVVISPMKVDVESDEPFVDEDYYVSRMDIIMNGTLFGKLHFLLPAGLFQLDRLRAPEPVEIPSVAVADTPPPPADNQKAASEQRKDDPVRSDTGTRDSLDILLIADDTGEAGKIAEVLRQMGYTAKTLSFKDNMQNYIPGELKAIYLVMKDVNEQAFGAAIKISSTCSLPIIAAGPAWTRTKVIKAVKYGIRDILLTPADEHDIEENVSNNLMQMAA